MDLSRAVWHKSTRSNPNDACVEVARLDGEVAVRDSKNPHGPALVFAAAEWEAFVEEVKRGALD